MVLPKLTPLQSRFAASLAASALLLFLYFSFIKPAHFAYAVELDSRIPPDHNHPILQGEDWTSEAENLPQSQHGVLRRAPAGVSALANNDPQNMNIEAGVTQNWMLPKDVVVGPHGITGSGLPGEAPGVEDNRKRQTSNTIYITVSTCLQPSANGSSRNAPPQLEVFTSTSSNNQAPGSANGGGEQRSLKMDGGYALITLEAEDDVYIGVSAPNTTDYTGIWNYQIAGSIDAPYQAFVNTTNLFFVDADDHSALFITNSTTDANSSTEVYQQWMKMAPPWGMIAHNQNDSSILGVRNSYCGLVNLAQVVVNLEGVDNLNVADMTNRGADKQPKEQLYVTSLNASSTYYGFLAQQGNSTASGNGIIGGGGCVWAATNFTTKADDNCALLYNLSFCSEVAYAVPANPDRYPSLPDLAALYDSNAGSLYQNFNYSLQLIPCNTTATAQYSLARNCDDCAHAYKQWLCAATIPRCEDFGNPAPYLRARNAAQPFINGSVLSPSNVGDQALLNSFAANASRNPIIDDEIRPGPYKEVLPCQDLCWDLVQSCPAALGFGCPLSGRGLEESYGTRDRSGFITCSYLGAAYYLNGAVRIGEVGAGTGAWVASLVLIGIMVL